MLHPRKAPAAGEKRQYPSPVFATADTAARHEGRTVQGDGGHGNATVAQKVGGCPMTRFKGKGHADGGSNPLRGSNYRASSVRGTGRKGLTG